MATILGFVSVYVVAGFVFFATKFLGKLLDNSKGLLQKYKSIFCAIMFTFFSFVYVIIYTLVIVVTGKMFINAMMCAIILVFGWYGSEMLYRQLAEEKGNEDEKIKVLSKEDKNVCHLFALIGVVLTGLMSCFEEKNPEYIILISVAVSIWIGAYIPLSDIYAGTPLKVIVKHVKSEFESRKKSVWISSVIFLFVVMILTSNNYYILKLNELIKSYSMGVAVGSLVLVFGVVIYEICRNGLEGKH